MQPAEYADARQQEAHAKAYLHAARRGIEPQLQLGGHALPPWISPLSTQNFIRVYSCGRRTFDLVPAQQQHGCMSACTCMHLSASPRRSNRRWLARVHTCVAIISMRSTLLSLSTFCLGHGSCRRTGFG